MSVCRCNWCDTVFSDGEEMLDSVCPKCEHDGCLMDLDGTEEFSQQNLKDLWEILGDTPVNDNDEIEEAFLSFPVGTDKIEIWEWFDSVYDKGVIALQFG